MCITRKAKSKPKSISTSQKEQDSVLYIALRILTFIWTSITGSAKELDALEYQPGSSSYTTKENKNKSNQAIYYIIPRKKC